MIVDTLSIIKLDKIGVSVPNWQRVVSRKQLDVDCCIYVGVLEDIDDPQFIELVELDADKQEYFDYVRQIYGRSVIIIMYPKLELIKNGSVTISRNCSPVILPDDCEEVNIQLEEIDKRIKDNIIVSSLGLIFKWGLTTEHKVVLLPRQGVDVH